MNRDSNEKLFVFVFTLAGFGLIIENYLLGWEFWVPVVVLFGIISLWLVNVSNRIEQDLRVLFYFVFAALIVFYHGIHVSIFFDLALTICMAMIMCALFNRAYMIRILLAEYFSLVLIHLFNIPGGEQPEFDKLSISRILLHMIIVLIVFFVSGRGIKDRVDDEEERRTNRERIEANDASMEDFLSNISHELRTPINVVNGMSDLLMKKGVKEGGSIKKAGIRLAYQVEDIQDYTECKRQHIFLEEENYMCTSLINDVVTAFRESDNTNGLELIVDLNPLTPTMMRGDIKKLHKIFRHLLENAIKFTKAGGIHVRMYTEPVDYGVNLCVEMTDTGMGMSRNAIWAVSDGLYQDNKERNRSSGGIGLGLYIVYGFAHRMGGFVKIESERGYGTTVRVTIPQAVVDPAPCLALENSFDGTVLFHVRPDKYKVPRVRDFYRDMVASLASGIKVPVYPAETVYEVERLKEKMNANYIFMGQEEYEENKGYFELLAREDIVVAVSADPGIIIPEGSKVLFMPKPLYAYAIIKVLNEGQNATNIELHESEEKPVFKGVKALIVDDEPMNLVVASSLFRDYEMIIDTAGSGKEALSKYHDNDYDIVFMDHMMPEMDGVEAMKRIKSMAEDMEKEAIVVALTANVVSGAREMFLNEGFDGFIAKPIDTSDFERVMKNVLPVTGTAEEGRDA